MNRLLLLAITPLLLSWDGPKTCQPPGQHGGQQPAVSFCADVRAVGPNNHRPAYYGRDDGCLWIPPGRDVPGDEWLVICDIARVDIY